MDKHKKSKRAFEDACRFFAGGVGSTGRVKPELGYPIYFKRGSGSRVFDIDGNEYIDYVLAMGPLILGHCPANVIKAVKKQIDLGTIFGSSIVEELSLARLICDSLPSVDLVRFTNSGSEAVHMAIRLARAYTGKSKILKFEGGYHGWFDDIWISVHPEPLNLIGLENDPYPIFESPGQCKSILNEILIAPWNQLDIIKKTVRRHGHEIAAIILEPIMCNNGVIPPVEGFLEELRAITEKEEIILIFDETITGFRIGKGGAQSYYHVNPDLTVFGKGIGGGYPIAGYGGKKEMMDLIADGKVGHFGTYNSNPLCVTAALATLKELNKNNGAVYTRMNEIGKNFMSHLSEIFKKNRINIVLQGPGSFFSSFFTDQPIVSYRDTFKLDRSIYNRFWLKMLDENIRIFPSIRGLWYLSAAHTEEDIDITLSAAKKVASVLKI